MLRSKFPYWDTVVLFPAWELILEMGDFLWDSNMNYAFSKAFPVLTFPVSGEVRSSVTVLRGHPPLGVDCGSVFCASPVVEV